MLKLEQTHTLDITFGKRIISLLLIAIAITFTLLISTNLYWTALNSDLSRNEHVYSEIGRVVKEGGLPYRDTWDHKPPALYYVLAGSIALFGNTAFAIHIVGVLIGTGFSIVMAALAHRLTHLRWAGILAGLAGFFYGSVWAARETSPDSVMILLGATAFLLVAVSRDNLVALAMAGLLFAAAFFSKQPVLLQLPALIWLTVWTHSHRKKRALAALTCGMVVGFLAVILWVFTYNIEKAFWYQAFETNFLYSLNSDMQWHFGEGFQTLFVDNFLHKTLPYLSPLIVLTIPSISASTRINRPRTIVWLIGTWLVTTSAGATIGRALSPEYFAQIVPPLIVLSVLGFAGSSNTFLPKLALLSTVVTLILVIQYPDQVTIPNFATRYREKDVLRPLIEVVQHNSDPQDCVWTWGEFEGHINYYAERRSCTRQLQSMPMMVPQAFDVERNRNDYMQDLLQTDPALLVQSNVWGYFPTLQKYVDRYRKQSIFHYKGLTVYTVDRSSWVPQNVNFSDTIRLLGIDRYQPDLHSGDVYQLAFTWKALHSIKTGYSLAIKLVADDKSQSYNLYDGLLVNERPTETWQVAEEIILGHTIDLHIPEDLSPGRYRLIAGLYNWETFEPLGVINQSNQDTPFFITLTTLEVEN